MEKNSWISDLMDKNQTEDIQKLFGWEENVVFTLLLLVSTGIGNFYGFFSRGKQKTTAEFLMANRSMPVFPMSMSAIASFISAITLLQWKFTITEPSTPLC